MKFPESATDATPPIGHSAKQPDRPIQYVPDNVSPDYVYHRGDGDLAGNWTRGIKYSSGSPSKRTVVFDTQLL
jgi:hypothetical protein